MEKRFPDSILKDLRANGCDIFRHANCSGTPAALAPHPPPPSNPPGSVSTWVYMKRSGQLLLASCVHFSTLAIHLFTPHCPCMLLSGKNAKVFFFFFFNYRSVIWDKMGRDDQIVFCVVRWSRQFYMSLCFLRLTPSVFIQIRPSVICQCKSSTVHF